MHYFVTGGTGLIGRNVVQRLLARGGRVTLLLRRESEDRLLALRNNLPASDAERLDVVFGDLSDTTMGLTQDCLQPLQGRIDHFFHIAGLYDMDASTTDLQRVNVEGTRQAIAAAQVMGAGCFHYVSSIAVSGKYPGTFREHMLDQARDLDHGYFRSKHDAELLVQHQCPLPWQIYRPGAVVGDARTGAIDKADGPYLLFNSLKRLRDSWPAWLPLVGIEGGLLNIVPVDFVAQAMDYIAHQEGQHGKVFHLTDSQHHTLAQVFNIFADVAGAPRLSLRIDNKLAQILPAGTLQFLRNSSLVSSLYRELMKNLGLPHSAGTMLGYATRYDNANTEEALAGSGIGVPPLINYAAVLWSYWEQNLDENLLRDDSLRGAVAGKTVLVTGASSGIGERLSERLASAGAKVLLVARRAEKLQKLQDSIRERGGESVAYPCDLSEAEQVDKLVSAVLAAHGRVDILVNNAGQSIRRSIDNSYQRIHDYERTMQLNFFGGLRLSLGLLPLMVEHGYGQVVNISTVGVLAHSPRFSAYIASKSALESFARCARSEYASSGVSFTNVSMPLVRTPMIAPTQIYNNVPVLSLEDAMLLVDEALIFRRARVITPLGRLVIFATMFAPNWVEMIFSAMHSTFSDTDKTQEKDVTGTRETQNILAIVRQFVNFDVREK